MAKGSGRSEAVVGSIAVMADGDESGTRDPTVLENHEDRRHWESVWGRVATDGVSWYQETSEPCLTQVTGLAASGDHIAVVGAGVSTLVQELVEKQYSNIEAIDISSAALDRLREALSDSGAGAVTLRQADVRSVEFDEPLDLWHDRATFHFLIDADDRRRYVERAAQAVRPGGYLVMATFGPGGPEMCSGLPVRRHGSGELAGTFGPAFELVDAFEREHHTPSQASQQFLHAVLRRE